jgi:hypothetical protein
MTLTKQDCQEYKFKFFSPLDSQGLGTIFFYHSTTLELDFDRLADIGIIIQKKLANERNIKFKGTSNKLN